MKISLNNRERLANEIVNGAVIIHGNTSIYRNNDVAYPFRQDSNFHYLTEWPEPDAHAVIVVKDSKPDLYLFVQDRNLEMETLGRIIILGIIENLILEDNVVKT